MLSRVAETVYWMSRYIERAENVARFIAVNLNLSLDVPGHFKQQWEPLVTTSGDTLAFQQRYDSPTRRNVVQFLTFDRENPNSIYSCLAQARENARTIREVISAEMWEHLNRCYLKVKETPLNSALSHSADFFEHLRLSGQCFMGVTDATMTHGEAWHFCQLGRSIERADKTSRILDVKYYILLPTPSDVGSALDDIQWSALLRSASALEMYRQKYGRILPQHVVQFLVLDKEFPRAILYNLTQANVSLHAISGSALGGFSNQSERHIGQLRSQLAYLDAKEIVSMGLHEFVDDLQSRLNNLSEAVQHTYFSPMPLDMISSAFSKEHQ